MEVHTLSKAISHAGDDIAPLADLDELALFGDIYGRRVGHQMRHSLQRLLNVILSESFWIGPLF